MKTSESYTVEFSSVMESESDVFSDLVALSGLNPQSDFQHSRLAGVDFGGSDLSKFNFDYADLRGVKWEERLSDPLSLSYSLRGSGTDEVRGSDFADLRTKLLSKSNWAERFFAFLILVDNWGENPDTAGVLSELLENDNGTYLPLCCFVYFTASYLNDAESKSLCVDMANAGRSQINIYRLGKLRRSAFINMEYFDSAVFRQRYPNDLSQTEFKVLIKHVKILIRR